MHWQSARLSLSAKSLQQEHGRDSRGICAVWYSYDTALLSICLYFSPSPFRWHFLWHLIEPLCFLKMHATLCLPLVANFKMVAWVYFGRTRVLAQSSACFWVIRCFWKRTEWVNQAVDDLCWDERYFSISLDAVDLCILRGLRGTNQTLWGLVFHLPPPSPLYWTCKSDRL